MIPSRAPAHLAADHRLHLARLALFERLSDTENHPQPGRKGRLGTCIDSLIALAEILPALGMADDDIGDAKLLEHIGGDFAGERAGSRPMAVLRAEPDTAARHRGAGGFEISEGTQSATSQDASFRRGFISPISAPAAARVRFIFQFPAQGGCVLQNP